MKKYFNFFFIQNKSLPFGLQTPPNPPGGLIHNLVKLKNIQYFFYFYILKQDEKNYKKARP